MATQCFRGVSMEKFENGLEWSDRIRTDRLSNSREYFIARRWSFEGNSKRLSPIPRNARTVYLTKCVLSVSFDNLVLPVNGILFNVYLTET